MLDDCIFTKGGYQNQPRFTHTSAGLSTWSVGRFTQHGPTSYTEPSCQSRRPVLGMLRADQELFTVLAAEFQQPLKASTVGAKPPLDNEIKKCMMDPRINVFLAPLPKSEHRATTDPPIKNKFEKKALQPKLDSNKVSPQSPAELQCLHLKTKDNKPLCWHRNLQKGCSNQVKKGRCKFGYHFCMTCLKPGHGAFECKN